MSFRTSILAICPPWLTGNVAGGIQYSKGLVLDAIDLWEKNGVKAAMPGYGVPDALYLIGRDMGIDRGPTETDAHYITRLQGAVDAWRTAGSPVQLLQQLAAWWSPSVATPIRLVNNGATWHEINLSTGIVTQTAVGNNWNWDGNTAKWWRGWLIIDSTAGPWTAKKWGDGGKWGDGTTWGSSANQGEIASIQNWIAKWKPANVNVVNIIVCFSATILRRTDASPPNPSGTANTPAWQVGVNAIFWPGPS